MRPLHALPLLVLLATTAGQPVRAENFFKKTGKELGHAVHDAGKFAGNLPRQAAKTVVAAPHGIGHAVGKAAHDIGHAVEKAVHDTGHAIEKAVHDTGHAIEKAVHDTGHAIEKAAHDVGHFFGAPFRALHDAAVRLVDSMKAKLAELIRLILIWGAAGLLALMTMAAALGATIALLVVRRRNAPASASPSSTIPAPDAPISPAP